MVDMSISKLPVYVTLLGKRVIADLIKLRPLRLYHSGLPRWALNPRIDVLIRDRRENRQETRRWPCEDGSLE